MKEVNKQRTNNNSQKLVEGIDYYFDEGLMVLTEHFLTKRAYCCGNGCRHCPYPKAQKSNLQ
jgi:hypothetical protein